MIADCKRRGEAWEAPLIADILQMAGPQVVNLRLGGATCYGGCENPAKAL